MTNERKNKKVHLAHKRAAAETRRYEVLEMFKAGVPERQIAKTLGIGVSTTHRDVQRVLGEPTLSNNRMPLKACWQRLGMQTH